jgi:integrase
MSKKKDESQRNRGQIVSRGLNTYLVRVYLGNDANGRRKYASKTIRGTYKAAEQYLTKCLREIDTQAFVEPSKRTLTEYLESWLAAKQDVAIRTLKDYRDRLRLHVIPLLGHQRLDQLRTEDIQQISAKMVERGLGRTIRYTYAILKQALGRAVRLGYLTRNPAEYVILPRQSRSEMKVLTPAQVNLFLEVTAGHPLRTLWCVLVTTGLRPGEALGLKWTDLDDSRVRVQRAVAQDDKNGFYLSETKTDKSRRSVRLPAIALAALEAHRARQAAEILVAGPAYERNGLIFANSVGRLLDQSKIRKEFYRALKRAGLPRVRLYDLRHSHATHLLMAGVHPKVVADRVGHSTTNLTLDTYSHVLPEVQEDAVQKVETLFKLAAAR